MLFVYYQIKGDGMNIEKCAHLKTMALKALNERDKILFVIYKTKLYTEQFDIDETKAQQAAQYDWTACINATIAKGKQIAGDEKGAKKLYGIVEINLRQKYMALRTD
jgi:hypothetical protein